MNDDTANYLFAKTCKKRHELNTDLRRAERHFSAVIPDYNLEAKLEPR